MRHQQLSIQQLKQNETFNGYINTLKRNIDLGDIKSCEKLIFQESLRSVLQIVLQEALFYAVEKSHVEMVWFLLGKGANVNAKNKNRETPLHIAAEKGYKGVVEVLLDNGADANAGDKYNQIPLYIAAEKGYLEIVKFFIESRVNINKDSLGNTLNAAALYGNKEIVDYLFTAGAEIYRDEGGDTSLHEASRSGEVEIVELFINHGIDVDVRNNRGRTPLYYAAKRGYEGVVKVLLDKGADVNAKDNNGMSPLHWATIEVDRTYIIEYLLQRGADLQARDDKGKLPLHYAAYAGCKNIAEFLLKMGADINAKDNDGKTPLYLAIEAKHIDTAELLIEKGADVNARDNRGMSPLHSAIMEKGNVNVVGFLLQRGADVDIKDNNGMSPLHYANQRGLTGFIMVSLGKRAECLEKENASLKARVMELEEQLGNKRKREEEGKGLWANKIQKPSGDKGLGL